MALTWDGIPCAGHMIRRAVATLNAMMATITAMRIFLDRESPRPSPTMTGEVSELMPSLNPQPHRIPAGAGPESFLFLGIQESGGAGMPTGGVGSRER